MVSTCAMSHVPSLLESISRDTAVLVLCRPRQLRQVSGEALSTVACCGSSLKRVRPVFAIGREGVIHSLDAEKAVPTEAGSRGTGEETIANSAAGQKDWCTPQY